MNTGRIRFLLVAAVLISGGSWLVSRRPAALDDDLGSSRSKAESMPPLDAAPAKPVPTPSMTVALPIHHSAAATILSRRLNLGDAETRARVVAQLRVAELTEWESTLKQAKQRGLPTVTAEGAVLAGFEGAQPIYEVDDNVNAAITAAVDLVRETAPFGVDGSGYGIGVWEAGGIPRATHQEFSGRLTIQDGASLISGHATHVSGSLIARGLNAAVKGMAPGATVLAHSSTSDLSEMTLLAAAVPDEPGTVYVSNHSYGTSAGWNESRTSWDGTFVDDGDPGNDFPDLFGRYSFTSASWDGLAWNAPYYLIFKSGGNHRNDNSPDEGGSWRHNGAGNALEFDPATHPAADFDYRVSGGMAGFDTVTHKGCAKNLVTVGATEDAVTAGVRDISRAGLTAFSSAGPTDDGRIKPDIVANGDNLFSLDDDSDSDVGSRTGTSMSTPAVCASALLLIDYYDDRLPRQAMLSSTLKGLLLHTADDLETPGPDYRSGWGLINAKEAARLIEDHAEFATEGRIIETDLSSTAPFRILPVTWNGTEPIRVTLCWTDPPGPATLEHDSRVSRLVHDLNLRVSAPTGNEDYFPYVMPWVGDWTDATLNAPATTGVNAVDNVEQVFIAAPVVPGEYMVTVNHAGTLGQGPQAFSLVVSGGKFPRGFPLWSATQFPGEADNPDVSGFSADPDGDRIVNGLEYAFNLNPESNDDSSAMFSAASETAGPDTYLTVTYERDLSKTDIICEAEWSHDLETWHGMSSVILSTAGTIETMKASVLMIPPRKFARIRVTQQ